jgi:hypothetical protein
MISPLHSVLKAEIPSRAAKNGHPVKDIVPPGIGRNLIATGQSQHGHRAHSGISSEAFLAYYGSGKKLVKVGQE